MAYKDSDELQSNENYALGEYSFRIERSSVPGSTNDQLTAICTQGGKNARKSIQISSSTQMSGWYVEANENTADVYGIIRVLKGETEKESGFGHVYIGNLLTENEYGKAWTDGPVVVTSEGVAYVFSDHFGSSGVHSFFQFPGSQQIIDLGEVRLDRSYTYQEKLVCYGREGRYTDALKAPQKSDIVDGAKAAWTALYGIPSGSEYEEKQVLIGRFAIDIADAGGVGPEGGIGGGWTDPEDYDEDWEEGDPTHTLYVEVTGALSGRHNDPIEDPSYSYIPSDKDTVKDYGCGGDGGHGGGGGAGASTVVIYKFATNQANFKEITAIARRHGYGSGGGKGGKGGDGCILVYY